MIILSISYKAHLNYNNRQKPSDKQTSHYLFLISSKTSLYLINLQLSKEIPVGVYDIWIINEYAYYWQLYSFATLQSTMNKPYKKNNNHNGQSKSRNRQDYQPKDDFIFNKTSLLSSALEKLKKKTKTSAPKRINEEPIPLPNQEPSKKIKTDDHPAQESKYPSLTYTPLQKDLYNFYTINKISLKNYKALPEPKLQMGSFILTAVCDRGIGGKYLVANLFRNKKAYIDFVDVPLVPTNEQKAIEALEAYENAGDFIIGKVIKPRNPSKIQISLSGIEDINEKHLRIGQIIIGEIKSKEQLGCHLKIKGLKKNKVYLPKSYLSEQSFEQLVQNKQIITVIKEIDEKKQLVKVTLVTEEEITLNLRGIQEEQMSKLQLQAYVMPGTLLNTKVIKVLTNGILVKFLKIFVGFIHADHLSRELSSYKNDQKLIARIIYSCNNPPLIFLSQKHKTLKVYEPQRNLYQSMEKPASLNEIQHAFLNNEEEFFAHPIHLHSQMPNITKFWAKENNYFEKYQIMSSKKVGLKVGDISKSVPFTNFKVYGSGQGKFRVMCVDTWNKVIKISYDKKIVQSKNLLRDVEDIEDSQKYCGFVSNVNNNGIVIEFCNNIKGILSIRQLELNSIEITSSNIGSAMEVYVTNNKKNYLGLTITPPDLRKKKTQHPQVDKEENGKESTTFGVIQSIQSKSIHPLYIKIKNKLIKLNIFEGIRPASLENLPIVQDLQSHYQIGERIQIFQKKGKYFLYPPQQLSDKQLRFCRIISVNGNSLRVQTRESQFVNCHICDVTDLVSPYPLQEYKVGDYTIGRMLSAKEITLRKSLVMNGLPETMKDVVKNYSQNEKRGDFRARIQAIGPSALKLESIAFGYIKSYTEKGCFISLSRNFDVRIQRSELSDLFIAQKEQVFTSNKLVLCRLISSKMKNQKDNFMLFDASLRQSVVKYGYPLNDQILQTGVGLTVKGSVTGYTKGKALVRLQSSKFTGIISLNDIQGLAENETLEKALPIGKQILCKIIQYSKEGQKRLIRLSTLKKNFKKYEGLETVFDSNANIIELWQHFKELSSIEAPIQQEVQIEAQVNNQDDEQYKRLKKLLAVNKIDVEDEDIEDQGQEDEEKQVSQEQQQQDQDQNQDIEPQSQEQEEKKQVSKKKTKKNKEETKELQRKIAQFQPLPHPKEFYQSLVLANPTPESYLLFISSLIPTSSPEEVRSQFLRAISNLNSISDKDNMWISWINTELLLGDFPGTVKKAVQSNVGEVVYFRILQILSEQENWNVGIEFGKKMLKKFNRNPKAYISFLKLVDLYERSGHEVPSSISIKEIMKRASQCLKSNDVIQIDIHHAKSLFESKQSQQGRNILQSLITKYPKRFDLWSVYTDQEIKHKNIDKARNLYERALSIGLKKKSTINILKRYLNLQKQFGTQQSADAIIQRAKTLASNYQNIEQDDQDIQDIQ